MHIDSKSSKKVRTSSSQVLPGVSKTFNKTTLVDTVDGSEIRDSLTS